MLDLSFGKPGRPNSNSALSALPTTYVSVVQWLGTEGLEGGQAGSQKMKARFKKWKDLSAVRGMKDNDFALRVHHAAHENLWSLFSD